ncbi:hypothetical protein J2W88_003796 [Acidovorax delafieldii]|uniref:Uncharacterized protein n=1 Tax=Acidovorax delafieldii TaxID=47920 RepID=A0AAJ2C1V2_ACIDE|nr:hypothetical protein [Acidovorax delafieldii]MDR6768492.1 hypothetical protein [Acidovorax delafieldii]MDR6837207.1 hypothetical protein [Acidovorax delafieldii]MDR7366698.1 hypothetical protein [Acidovorax delafieldii]
MKYLWLVHLPLLVLLGYLYWRNRSMKQRQDALVQGLKERHYWRINLARPGFYKSWLRIMPFEAKGVLIDDGEIMRIKGFWLKGHRPFESSIDKASASVQWLGNRHLRAGNLYWAELNTPRGALLFCADTGMYALPSREALSDIFRSAFPDYGLDEQQTADFALEKNPRSISMVAAFFALFLFSLIDTFVISRFELTDAQLLNMLVSPLLPLGAAAGAGVLLLSCYFFMNRGGVPARESMVVGTFVALAALGATLPAAKRVDQWLADGPTQAYAYRVTSNTRLEPVDPSLGLPRMYFPRAREYWNQFPPGSDYQIPFLRGPLGLWQLDHAAFDPPLIAFYEKR